MTSLDARHLALAPKPAAELPRAGLASAPSHRDGVRRDMVVSRPDGGHRVAAAKAIEALGWAPGDTLVARVRARDVVIRQDAVKAYADVPVTLDKLKRLHLAPTITAALDLGAGDLVCLVGIPDLGELHLYGSADAAALLTGPLAGVVPVATPPVVEDIRPAPATRSRLRPRWTPPAL